LAEKCWALYQTQAETTLTFWMEAASKAIAAGQKAMEEWADLTTQVVDDTGKAFEANVKEATQAFAPAA